MGPMTTNSRSADGSTVTIHDSDDLGPDDEGRRYAVHWYTTRREEDGSWTDSPTVTTEAHVVIDWHRDEAVAVIDGALPEWQVDALTSYLIDLESERQRAEGEAGRRPWQAAIR